MKSLSMKLIPWVLAGTLLFLPGCGAKDTPNEPAAQTTAGDVTTTPPTETPTTPPTALPVDSADMGKVVSNDFVLSVAGEEVELQDDPAALLAALGKPAKESENEYAEYWIDRCGSYEYPSLHINTGRYEDGHEQIMDVTFTDNTIMLNKGIVVGSTRDEVTAAYGKPQSYEEDATGFSYTLPIGEYEYRLFFDFTSHKSGKWETNDTVQRIVVSNDYFDCSHEPTA